MDFELSNIGIVAALAAGAISFLSPCVLPLVPSYVSFIAGRARSQERDISAEAVLSLCFVLGFSTVFVALGASATALSRMLRVHSYEAGIAGGAIILVFGVLTTGLVRFPWLQRDLRYHGAVSSSGPFGAYTLGLAFAFGWTPCIGPILTVGAISATATDGVVLLSLYSFGLGVPFVLAALFTEALMDRLPRMRRVGRFLQIAAGGVMILMGLAMMTGQMTRLAFWLLGTFPAFGSIG